MPYSKLGYVRCDYLCGFTGPKRGHEAVWKGKNIDTSVMLYKRPDLAHTEKLEDSQENRPLSQTKGRAVWYAKKKDIAYYSPDNYRNSSNSSAELGEKLLDIISDNKYYFCSRRNYF